jgi:glutathione peroxidase
MRLLVLFTALLISTQITAQTKNLHDFNASTIHGENFDFSTLKGKKVLIVNTASKCSLAPQFKKLQELYEEYDLEIIAFPSNDFGKREPEDNETIYEFCTNKYNITFQMMEKISVKGEDQHPVYKWLTSSDENGTLDANVTWNFQKFLIDEQGEIVDVVPPLKGPKCNRIIDWLSE